jgi:aspartate 1-decarboxylase
MLITMLKAKLHRALVTRVERDYEGSCAIDATLLQEAGIREYEQIHVYNVDNGERFTTYAIRAQPRSGVISVNGAAAHRAARGHRLIICAYALLDEQELPLYRPTLIYLDERNRILGKRDAIPVQAA